MSFAPIKACDEGIVKGRFDEASYNKTFEFASRTSEEMKLWASEFPVKIYVGPFAGECRAAKILKTRAYVAVDEDSEGNPVTEIWHIRNLKLYK
jgi:hypothetical protein